MDAETRQEITRIDHAMANINERLKDILQDAKDCKKTCTNDIRDIREKQGMHSERISAFEQIMPRLEAAVERLQNSVDGLTDAVGKLQINTALNTDSAKGVKAMSYEVIKYVVLFILATAIARGA